jgi:hypothetical protein
MVLDFVGDRNGPDLPRKIALEIGYNPTGDKDFDNFAIP